MKRFLIIALSALLFTSCTKHVVSTGIVTKCSVNDFCALEELASTFSEIILVDRHTGCLYVKHGYGMSPIIEPDGTSLTYDEWKERLSNGK